VPDSPWILEFAVEPILEFLNEGIIHYMIVTEDDVIEVLDNQEPRTETLG
jgi:hypothetical protein